MTPSQRSRTTCLIDFGILLGLPDGRPGPGLVPFAKYPFASRFSFRFVSCEVEDGPLSAFARILSRSLSTASCAFRGTLEVEIAGRRDAGPGATEPRRDRGDFA